MLKYCYCILMYFHPFFVKIFAFELCSWGQAPTPITNTKSKNLTNKNLAASARNDEKQIFNLKILDFKVSENFKKYIGWESS